MDHAGAVWMTAFNEVAEQLMGVPANEIQQLKVSCIKSPSPEPRLTYQDSGEDTKATAFFQNPIGKTFTFQMMAKQDSYNVSWSLPKQDWS